MPGISRKAMFDLDSLLLKRVERLVCDSFPSLSPGDRIYKHEQFHIAVLYDFFYDAVL
jgi:hypothetical protein